MKKKKEKKEETLGGIWETSKRRKIESRPRCRLKEMERSGSTRRGRQIGASEVCRATRWRQDHIVWFAVPSLPTFGCPALPEGVRQVVTGFSAESLPVHD